MSTHSRETATQVDMCHFQLKQFRMNRYHMKWMRNLSLSLDLDLYMNCLMGQRKDVLGSAKEYDHTITETVKWVARHWDSYTDDGFDFDINNVNLIYTCLHKNLVSYKSINNKYQQPIITWAFSRYQRWPISIWFCLSSCVNIWWFSASCLNLIRSFVPNLVHSKNGRRP